jgi:hypothetical protein
MSWYERLSALRAVTPLPRIVTVTIISGNEIETERSGSGRGAILFVIPPGRFRGDCCVPCALLLTQEGPIISGFSQWRGGRVAEGGGLLNRYTV